MNSTMTEEGLREPTNGHYTVLAPAFAKWFGSDARALAQALRRLGHTVLETDEEDYVPWRWQGFAPKILRRLFGSTLVDEYNQAVIRHAANSSYDFVLVFKGKMLRAETVRHLGKFGKPIFNIYPDVSFEDHGANLPEALRYYDCVFTTKSYHGDSEKQMFGIRNLERVRHGFDPEVHRPVAVAPDRANHYGCDVSFVGCWSPEKEQKILYLLKRSNNISIKVYGIGWEHASAEFKQRMGSNLRPGVFGDELAIVYSSSKVNLGLLSSSKSQPRVRDQTTARTFQIPATKALLLHEDTPEVRSLFKDGEEILLFTDNDDMADKVNYALKESALREVICERGRARSVSEPYDYSTAASKIVRYFENRI